MKNTKLIPVFLTVVAVIFFLFFREDQNASIARKLKKIPQDECQYLDFFFRSQFSAFGYCLFGNKPIAVLGYYDPFVEVGGGIDGMLDHVFCIFNPVNLKMYRGWELWNKHQHFFPMKNYAFIKSKNFVDNNYVALIFINKMEFLKTVKSHLNDFKKVLGNRIAPESLLEDVLKSQDVFGDVLKHHQTHPDF